MKYHEDFLSIKLLSIQNVIEDFLTKNYDLTQLELMPAINKCNEIINSIKDDSDELFFGYFLIYCGFVGCKFLQEVLNNGQDI